MRKTVLSVACVGLVLLLACEVGLLGAEQSARAGAFPGASGKIAFVSNRDGNDEIYTTPPAGSGVKQLTHTAYPSGNETPAVSADGTKIVFERDKELWIMNADGTGQRQLTSNTVFDHDPTFSPDGKKIAFLTRRDTDAPSGTDNIWLMNTNGTNQSRLTSGSNVTEPTFSPEGSKIAFVKGGELWVVDPASTGAGTQYTFSNTGNPDTSVGAVTSPTFSPNGSLIEFRATGGALHCSCTGYFTVSSGGSNPNLLRASDSSDAGFAFSPDGTKVAFQSTNRDGNTEIYTMNPDGSGVANISNDPSFVDNRPDWGPKVTQQGTTLSLSAKPQGISSGQSATLSGKLSTGGGKVYAGQKVTIEKKPKGATSFVTLKTVSTNFAGTYKLSVTPSKSTYYKAVFGGNQTLGLGASSSASTLVTVN